MKKTKILIMVMAIGVTLFLGGAKAPAWFDDYGRIAASDDVRDAYEGYRFDPGLVYYYIGSEEQPDAIIGVNKSYTLDSTLWKKISITPEIFQNLVSRMEYTASEATWALHGFAILDNRGMSIGTWYSPLQTVTTVRMVNGNAVDIPTPDNTVRLSVFVHDGE